jgi:DNA-binding beta-propeller fold protein YncE
MKTCHNFGFDRMRFALILTLTIVPLALPTLRPALAAPANYHVERRIPIPGDGGWDLLAVDAPSRRLFVTRGTRVQVVDLEKKTLISEIPDLHGVHGVALAPGLKRGFISCAMDSVVAVFDLASLRVLDRIKVPGGGADAIMFEPVTKRVFVFCGRSNNAVAIDAASGAVVGSIALDGRPELGVADGRGGVFVNLEDSSAVVAFDARTLQRTARWSLAPGTGPSGLAMDPAHRVLFSVCENKMMVAMDADSGRVLATLPIGERVDGATFDADRQLAFSSNGDGTLTVVQENEGRRFEVIANVTTQRGARTVALDEKTHHVITVTSDFGPTPEATADHPHPRPPMIPGTFNAIVVAP